MSTCVRPYVAPDKVHQFSHVDKVFHRTPPNRLSCTPERKRRTDAPRCCVTNRAFQSKIRTTSLATWLRRCTYRQTYPSSNFGLPGNCCSTAEASLLPHFKLFVGTVRSRNMLWETLFESVPHQCSARTSRPWNTAASKQRESFAANVDVKAQSESSVCVGSELGTSTGSETSKRQK